MSLQFLLHLLEGLRILHSLLVIFRGFPLLKCDCAGWAIWQAVTKPVTKVLPNQPCFTVYDIDRALIAGFGTQAAPVALFFVDMNNLSDHSPSYFCH